MFKRRKKSQVSRFIDYQNRGYEGFSLDSELHQEATLGEGQTREDRIQHSYSSPGGNAEDHEFSNSFHGSPNRMEEPHGQFESLPESNLELLDALTGVDSSLSSLDQRLNAMNSVLRQQAEAIDRNSESGWYFMLKAPTKVLAEVHSNLVQQVEIARESGSGVEDLEFIKDGIEESLGMLGIEILPVIPGDQFSEALHRRVRVEDVDDPSLSKTVRPASEGRASFAYRFRNAANEGAVRKAFVTVLRYR